MTYDVAKEKLHSYIEHAQHDKVMAMYTLLEMEMDKVKYTYDDETIALLEKISDDVSGGRMKTYTAEESLERIRKQRKKHGI